MSQSKSNTSTHRTKHWRKGRPGSEIDRTPHKRPLVGVDLERCVYCNGKAIKKIGKRYKQHEILQRWYCHQCAVSFSPRTASKGSTYPLKVILETLCRFYQGHTIDRTADYIRRRFGLTVHPRTISRWLTEYRPLTTFARLRDKARAEWPPHRLIRSTRLHHKQVYTYRIHHGKLEVITRGREHQAFQAIADYLTNMAENCPHHLFQDSGNSGKRASQGKATFNLDAVEIKAKRNHACCIAELVLQTVTINKRRHDEIQRFMLITDSVTVAVEVPIILTPEDIRHMQRELGFDIPIEIDTTLTGHIDVLQIRNGKIHILDYKPGANKEKPIAQLMVYALALSRRTGLRLYDFVCAWFDEHDYFEFYPLHVVHKRHR
jgi:plasmid stabilization system protein ParE